MSRSYTIRRITRKKAVAVIAGAAVVVAGAGAAYAYWTTGGSGTGTAATGTSANIVVNQDALATPLAPGVAAQDLHGDFTNASTSPVYVTTVTASIASLVKAGGAPAGACVAADYTLTNAVMDVGREIPIGTNVGARGDGSPADAATIQFNSTSANQDGCKLATVNLAYVIA